MRASIVLFLAAAICAPSAAFAQSGRIDDLNHDGAVSRSEMNKVTGAPATGVIRRVYRSHPVKAEPVTPAPAGKVEPQEQSAAPDPANKVASDTGANERTDG